MGVPTGEDLPPELQGFLRDFAWRAESLVEEFVSPINARPPPETIYHYTDDRGLRGILESGILRFTNVFSLNDPSELRHGMSHAASLLRTMSKGGPAHCKAFAGLFAEFVEHGLHKSAHLFTCSFSKNGDELGQ